MADELSTLERLIVLRGELNRLSNGNFIIKTDRVLKYLMELVEILLNEEAHD